MLTLDDKALKGLKMVVKDAPATTPSPELLDILREMKRFNSVVVSVLSQPQVPPPTSTITTPTPIVNVQPPSVSVTPSIRIEQPARRWRFTVTKRDQTAQQRIQEIIVESLE
jgi:hypothetical protein